MLVDQCFCGFAFAGFGGASESEFEGSRDWIACGFPGETLGEELRLIDQKRVVQQRQRLQGRGGDDALGFRQRRIRTIVLAEHFRTHRARRRLIDRATIGFRRELFDREVGGDVVYRVAEEMESRAAHATVKLAAGGEDAVADRLCAQALRWKAPQQRRIRIHASFGRIVGARSAVSIRQHDLAMQWLHAPSAGDQLLREQIEQLGMRGALAVVAEVARRIHESAAEVLLPDAIRQHARRQRISRIPEPSCEGHATLALRLRFVHGESRKTQCRQACWNNRLAAIHDVATVEQMDRILRLGGFACVNHRQLGKRGELPLHIVALCLQLLVLIAHCLRDHAEQQHLFHLIGFVGQSTLGTRGLHPLFKIH